MSQGKTRDIDRIMVERGRRGDFSPRQSDHYHNYYEIFFLLSGNCRFLLNDSVYPLEKGDFVLIAPGSLHHALYDTARAKFSPSISKRNTSTGICSRPTPPRSFVPLWAAFPRSIRMRFPPS